MFTRFMIFRSCPGAAFASLLQYGSAIAAIPLHGTEPKKAPNA